MKKKNRFYITVKTNQAGKSLNNIISDHLKYLSVEQIQFLIINGNVYIDRKRVKDPQKVVLTGQTITVYKDFRTRTEEISFGRFNIIFKDSFIIAVNKPPGMPSDETREGRKGTLPHYLEKLLPKKQYFQIVHRLDKDTSGIILVSLKPSVTKNLSAQFRTRKVSKWYAAIVEGQITPVSNRIIGYLARDSIDPRKMRLFPKFEGKGKYSETLFKVLALHPENNFSSVLVKPLTGRTHQIRVHLASIGHPIVGDRLYGSQAQASRMFLHAMAVLFVHPDNKTDLKLICPPDITFRIPPESKDIFNKNIEFF